MSLTLMAGALDFANYAVADWIEIGVSSLACVLFFILALIAFKGKKMAIAFFGIGFALLIAAIFLQMISLIVIIAAAVAAVFIVGLISNAGSIQELFDDPLRYAQEKKQGRKNVKSGGAAEPAPFDKTSFLNKLNEAVIYLSNNKIGALICIEKTTPLKDFIGNATVLNIPFIPELVESIFYVGTRLHDGAMMVKDGTILAASCYLTPTTRPINGKFGSRHRAAMGISERADCVTVLVSEETCRIQLFYKGKIIDVTKENFRTTVANYLGY